LVVFFLKASSGVSPDAVGACGFVSNSAGQPDRSTSTLSFNNSTRTFTITPVGSFEILIDAVSKVYSTSQSIVIPNTEGKWFFYFDSTGTIQCTNDGNPETLILPIGVLIASVYWSVASQSILGQVKDERHGVVMDRATHCWLHENIGTKWNSGLQLTGFNLGVGTLNTDSQFTVNSGAILDEDLKFNIPQYINSLNIMSINGAGILLQSTNTGYTVLTGTNGKLVYNDLSTYSLVEATSGNYVLCHVVALNGLDLDSGEIVAFVGQNQYTTLELAVAGAPNEVTIINGGHYLSNENLVIGTVILQTSDSFTNATQSMIVQPSLGLNYLDWRFSVPIASEIAPVEHDSIDPKLVGVGETYGHLNDGTQSIAGTKTFTNGLVSQTVQLNTSSTPSSLISGQVGYDINSDSLIVGASQLKIGKELIELGYNNSGSTITKGSVIYFNGAITSSSISYPTIALGIADTISHASNKFAIVKNDITNNSFGELMVIGTLSGLDTSSLTQGNSLYVSPTTAGSYTATLPTYPNGISYIGLVTLVDSSNGTIFINTNNILDVPSAISAANLVSQSTTVNGHALSSNVTISASDLTTGTLPHAQLPTLLSADIPNNTANTSGTASNLSGTPVLPNGTTATTQLQSDGSTKLATTSYVDTGLGTKISTYTSQTAKTVLAAPNAANGTPSFRALVASDIPTLNQSTTGNASTASNLSGTPALPNGTTGTTQTTGDNSTNLATTAYVDAGDNLTAKLAGTQTLSGNNTFSGQVIIGGEVLTTSIISPTSLSSTTDNYNPTGFSTCNIMRQAASTNITLNGFVAQSSGFEFTLINISSSSITIANNAGTTTAANRVLTPNAANMVIRQQGSATFIYDGVSSIWRVKHYAI